MGAPAGAQFGGPVVPLATMMDYAGFWSRFAAAFVDGIILVIVEMLIYKAMGVSLFPDMSKMAAAGSAAGTPGMPGGAPPTMPGADALADPARTQAGAICSVLCFVYYTVFLAVKGATPGKMALGLQVVRADGSPIGAGTAVLRVVIEWILSCVTLGVTYLALAFSQKKQGFHDMIAGTVVIRTR